jgi:hypothetical protein
MNYNSYVGGYVQFKLVVIILESKVVEVWYLHSSGFVIDVFLHHLGDYSKERYLMRESCVVLQLTFRVLSACLVLYG